MQVNRVLEQHIAVFGESGSGKTVMVSCFYGATQVPQFLKSSLFDVTADNTAQGHQLYKNYLGMRDSALPPGLTALKSTAYAFSVKLREKGGKPKRPKPFDALRLVWHDYPGEWFERDPEPTIAERRVDTFRSLLGSDVALLLVDGQKLLDNAGEEERYLMSLFRSFQTGLLKLKDQLLDEGRPLVRFPRIWVLALSKADLLPELDVFGFRDLIIGNAYEALDRLREELKGFVDSPDALDVGEDFVLFSSAKFEANKIDVTERKGLDLVLPLAGVLPLERHVKWVTRRQLPAKVASDLLEGLGDLAVALIDDPRFAVIKSRLELFFGREAVDVALRRVAELSADELRKLNEEALAKRDFMAAVLTRFRLDLDDAEGDGVLLRNRR